MYGMVWYGMQRGGSSAQVQLNVLLLVQLGILLGWDGWSAGKLPFSW